MSEQYAWEQCQKWKARALAAEAHPDVAAERERCAICADEFAHMMERGAGEVNPGDRLRQLARKIREGDLPLGYPRAVDAYLKTTKEK